MVRTEKDGSLLIDAGWATGWSDSSRVAIYRAGTKPSPGSRPLAVGLLTQSQSDVSKLAGAHIPLEIPAAQLRAYLTEPAWLRSSISLGFVRTDRDPGGGEASEYFSEEEVQSLRDRLADLRFLNLKSSPEVWVRKSKRGYELFHGVTGNVLGAWTSSGEPADDLPGVLRTYALGRMVQRVPVFSTSGSLVNVGISEDADRVPVEESSTVSLIVRIVNPFEVPMYVNLLELSPDGGIRSLLPGSDSRESVEELMVSPRSERSFTETARLNIRRGEASLRQLMWFMSPLPMDLRGLGGPDDDVFDPKDLRGFGQFRTVDFTRPEDAVYVPESLGLSGMLFLRLASGGDR
jgi:hypothetical protein